MLQMFKENKNTDKLKLIDHWYPIDHWFTYANDYLSNCKISVHHDLFLLISDVIGKHSGWQKKRTFPL